MVRTLVLASVLMVASAPAWADAVVQISPLPAPGIFGLVAAGVIGAVLAGRRRR